MLTLVISTPHPSAPDDAAARRLAWRDWVRDLERQGQVRAWYLRAGRGAAVVFDLPDNETLHARLTEWLTYVAAGFDIFPLVDAEQQERLLRRISGQEPTGA